MARTAGIAGVALCVAFAVAGNNAAITIVGEVSDSQCAFTVHSSTGSHEELIKSGLFGATAEDCVRACVRFGGKFVLVDELKKKIYQVANPEAIAEYAGKQVRVRGTIDQKGVLSIQEIEIAKVADGKTKR